CEDLKSKKSRQAKSILEPADHPRWILGDEPYFETVALMRGCNGDQFRKWTILPVSTRTINVSKRAYFAEIAERRGIKIKGGSFSVESVFWMNTGYPEAILSLSGPDTPPASDKSARPDPDPQYTRPRRSELPPAWVASVTLDVISVRQSVTPGFGFAVITDQG